MPRAVQEDTSFIHSDRATKVGILIASSTLTVLGTLRLVQLQEPGAGAGTYPVTGFHIFWAAGQLVIEGALLGVLNQDPNINCRIQWRPRVLPPLALMFFVPFGALPLKLNWIAFNAIALCGLWVVVRPLARQHLFVRSAIVFAPTIVAAMFVGALVALRCDRQIVAGALIGVLTIKPTLGLLIPFDWIGAGFATIDLGMIDLEGLRWITILPTILFLGLALCLWQAFATLRVPR